MFSLFCGAFQYIVSRPQYNIIMLGLDGAGKTTLLEQIKSLYLNLPPLKQNQIRPTVGLNIAQFDVATPQRCRLVCWDLGGQAALRSLWDKYFVDADAVMFVIDAHADDRFDEALQILDKLVQHCIQHHMPLLIMANKQDLSSGLLKERVETLLGSHNAVSNVPVRRICHVQPSTALVGSGVQSGLQWLVDALGQQRRR